MRKVSDGKLLAEKLTYSYISVATTSVREHVKTRQRFELQTLSLSYFLRPPGDSTSVATEYSLKFDESMTEDEIEERSFRSLLPSEAHRRGTKEKKSHHHEESEDDGANHNMALVSGTHNILKVQRCFIHTNISQHIS